MKRILFVSMLGLVLALALGGCDYGYADGEDPALVDDQEGTLQFGLRVDEGQGADGDRYEAPSVVAPTNGAVFSVGHVQSTQTTPSSSLPIQHPDPKPWKK